MTRQFVKKKIEATLSFELAAEIGTSMKKKAISTDFKGLF